MNAKTSIAVWIIIAIVAVAGLGWWLLAMPAAPALAPEATTTAPVVTQTHPTPAKPVTKPTQAPMPAPATTTPADTGPANPNVPGDKALLGQDTSASFGNYLVASNGHTVYTFANDSSSLSTCTGTCATTWPPYTVSASSNLLAESMVGGTLGTIKRADGSTQLTYNGHPLYYYAGDTVLGGTKGEGIGGVWHVAKP